MSTQNLNLAVIQISYFVLSAFGRVSPTKSTLSVHLFLKTYVWRLCNPSPKSHTYPLIFLQSINHSDYFIFHKGIFHFVTQCDYGATVISDHGPLYMKILIFNTVHPPPMATQCPTPLEQKVCLFSIIQKLNSISVSAKPLRNAILYCWESLKVADYFILC